MSHTLTSPSLHRESFQRILERVALPLLIFAAVLFLLLFVSWFSILPRFTQFAVEDTTLTPNEMATYVSHLKAELTTQEETRDRLVLPLHEPSYDTLKAEKRSQLSAYALQVRLLQVASSVSDTADSIVIMHLSIDGSTVQISGDVRNVGLRSMTVLASYVEAIQVLPFIKHVERPAFDRQQNADGTSHSPFTMTITLTQP